MKIYKITIATGYDLSAGTLDHVSVVLVGDQGESAKHQLPHNWQNFRPNAVTTFEVNMEKDFGKLLLIRLSTEQYKTFNMDPWFCKYVQVTSPKGQLYQFPFYQWIPGTMTMEIPEGKGVILSGSTPPLLQKQRRDELEKQRETHKWKYYAEGIPRCIDADNVEDLPCNDQYSFQKLASFNFTLSSTGSEVALNGFMTCKEPWTDLGDIRLLTCLRRSENSDKVADIWKDDHFFGSQYLNGINPTLIKKFTNICENFPVADHMVAASLGTSTNLQKEMENGNLFLADYKILQGVPANTINGKIQYIAAPLCLLWKNPQGHLVPILIKLNQNPGVHAPVFCPCDSEWDWLLAKIWVRNADFQVHEVVTHLLRTHLFAEVFNIATTRQLPMSHPLYKETFSPKRTLIQPELLLYGVLGAASSSAALLLIPHLRFTLEINVLARKLLIGPGGLFDQAVVVGNGGIPVLLKKAMDEVTYSSLCLPDDIQARGVQFIPNYLYRDDGMKIWSATESFVSNIVNYYYKSDAVVRADPELQAWVAEIFKEGFLEKKSSGIPSFLETKASLIKYLTMVIFTCSAQHAAVNSGQFDTYAWMPNGPTSMKKPPPAAKGISTLQSILDTLPEVNTTTSGMTTVWLLSNEPCDKRQLGQYPDWRFTEELPLKFIQDFQAKLKEISNFINQRNQAMELPYWYLDPNMIENSVSV